MRREVGRYHLQPVPLLPKGGFHLYLSRNNVGASNLMQLLEAYHSSRTVATPKPKLLQAFRASKQLTASRSRRPLLPISGLTRRQINHASENGVLKYTSDPKQMRQALHFLCYLNADTHTSGPISAQLHTELEQALRAGVHILLVHETRLEANGAPFKTIIDATPENLKWSPNLAEKRLYKELAIMICGSTHENGTHHLNVGLHLMWNAICVPPKQAVDRTMTDVLQDVDLGASEAGVDSNSTDSLRESSGSLLRPSHTPLEESRNSVDGASKLCAPAAYEPHVEY